MLGTENTHELDVVCLVQVADAAHTCTIDAGVVRQQRNALAGQWREVIAHETVDAGHYRRVAARSERNRAVQEHQETLPFHRFRSLENHRKRTMTARV